MDYINYPLSVILNVENNPYAQGSLPNIVSPNV